MKIRKLRKLSKYHPIVKPLRRYTKRMRRKKYMPTIDRPPDNSPTRFQPEDPPRIVYTDAVYSNTVYL